MLHSRLLHLFVFLVATCVWVNVDFVEFPQFLFPNLSENTPTGRGTYCFGADPFASVFASASASASQFLVCTISCEPVV